MEKFSVIFAFDSGQSQRIIIEAENEEFVSIKVLKDEKWFKHNGLLINLDNVNCIKINKFSENPGAVYV